ncbi:DedA family protein [Planosporangium thailandense]|uniref:DedA family protein n=1 Tax=Planosporangium thailandense TaxID=765197 RepID=A0ABX0Y1G0_9ACTN|nr:DedA family protein [Planosporangium thailandense]NJC71194.1 DedA family protein [Planosporangium thailandense]
MAHPEPLPGFLGHVAPLLDRYGYLAIAWLVGVESFGVPAPGQTIIIAAAVYAGAGRLNIVAVATVAFVVAVLGDNIGYAIGRIGGHRLVHRYGRYVRLTPERLDRAERFFARRGGLIVVIARFIDGLRQFNGVIAGINEMGWKRFLACNALGAALWVGLWSAVGYTAGVHAAAVYHTIHRYHWYAIGALIALVGGVAALHVIKRRRRRRPAPDPGDRSAVDERS